MGFFDGFLCLVTHVVITVFLLFYLPVSWLWRLTKFVFVKPFSVKSVKEKVVLITGASSGIGEELAYEYATRGALLILVARREQALKEVANNALAKGSPDVLVIKADVSIESECKRVIEEAVARFAQFVYLKRSPTYKFAKIVVDSACSGDGYVTWPSWYKPFHALMFFAPEAVNWYSRSFYLAKPGVDSNKTLSRTILDATGAKDFVYPPLVINSSCKHEILDDDKQANQ